MKKILSIFIIFACAMPSLTLGAVNVKKAAPVATKKTDAVESAGSLVPTVLGLVGSVQSLNAQQQQLSADCAPTSDEINTVNELVKEWAKVGTHKASEASSGLGSECSVGTNYSDTSYKYYMETAYKNETCHLTFSSTADKGRIWEGFPKASKASVCDVNNSKNCKTVSNIYDVFVKIPFGQTDYTKSETQKIAKLIEKSEKCAPSKINAAKREMWGSFLTQTVSGVGKTSGVSGTDSIMQAVSSFGGNSDLKSMLPSLSQMALQSMDK